MPCFLAIILFARVFAYGSGFQLFNHPCQTKHGRLSAGQYNNYRQRRSYQSSSSALFGRLQKDASIVASNKKYLMENLGFSAAKLKKATAIRDILTLDNSVLKERVNWLKERLNLKDGEVKKMVHRYLDILRLRPDTNLAPKLDYLQSRLLLDDNSLRKLILGTPIVLARSIEDNMEVKLEWLQQRLALDDTAVSKMVLKYPSILGYSINDNLEPKLEWIQQRLGLDDSAVGKVIQRLPSILGSSIPNSLEPTLDWLQHRLSLTDGGLSRLIQSMPQLFSCNVDTNLEPTLNFYIHALGDEGGALALVIRYPDMFGYSLEKRLKPRLDEAKSAGMIIDALCLQRIAKNTEKQWQSLV